MTEKIKVESSYFTFEEAIGFFDTLDDVRTALFEGEIIAEGYKFTDVDQYRIEMGEISDTEIIKGKERDFTGWKEVIPQDKWRRFKINIKNYTCTLKEISQQQGETGFEIYSGITIHKDEFNKCLSYCPDYIVGRMAITESRKRKYKHRKFIALFYQNLCNKYPDKNINSGYIWDVLTKNWRDYSDYLMDYDHNKKTLVWINASNGQDMTKSTLANVISQYRKGEITISH